VQLESALRSGGSGAPGSLELVDDESVKNSMMQQNVELRRRLDEEHSGYRRKLQAFQDEQQRQTQLVQKLHAKVYIHSRDSDTLIRIIGCIY